MQQGRPWQDYGFFGPDSMSWRIWTSPTSVIGFQRSVVLEHFDPFLTAAVADTGKIYQDPHGRLDHTFAYFLIVAVADGRTAIEASEHLMKVHAKATGIEPISGKRYSANNPDSQLWIHITGWHSVLKCYELYGPGKLTPDEERQYWSECAVAAELQTCKPSDIPRSRDEVREYYAMMRPKLCTSERANQGMQYLLRPPRSAVGWRLWVASRFVAPLAIATLPQWMRKLGGYEQSGVFDRMIRPPARIGAWVTSKEFTKVPILRMATPAAAEVIAQHHARGVPANPVTVTPAQARRLSVDGSSLREASSLPA